MVCYYCMCLDFPSGGRDIQVSASSGSMNKGYPPDEIDPQVTKTSANSVRVVCRAALYLCNAKLKSLPYLL